MKVQKGWVIGISVVLVLLGIGCLIWSQQLTTKHAAKQRTVTSTKTTTGGKTLILYYSNSGTTKRAAEEIQSQTGAKLVELKLSPDYPKTYTELGKFAQNQLNQKQHPKITNQLDLKQYSTIYLGFPTWFHRPPMFIDTFFETYDLKGKMIIPFTTSASSSIAESTPYLTKLAKGTGATLQTGFRANETSVITKYLKQHDLEK